MTADDAMVHRYFDNIKEQGYIKEDGFESPHDSVDSGATDCSQNSNVSLCSNPMNCAIEHECESEKNIRIKVSLLHNESMLYQFEIIIILFCKNSLFKKYSTFRDVLFPSFTVHSSVYIT
jgi:hypothetical protein